MGNSVNDPAVRFLANQTIMAARSSIARLQDFTTDFSADAVQPGSTMLIQFFDDGEAGAFNASTNNYGNADGSVSFIPVKFSNHCKKSFQFTPKDYMDIGANRWQNAGDAAGRAVSRALLHTVVKLINPVNVKTSGKDLRVEEDGTKLGTMMDFGTYNEVVAGTSQAFDKNYVAKTLIAACDSADIDPADTVILVNGSEWGDLLASLDANTYGDRSAIADGRIAGLYGFRAVVKVDNLTKLAGCNLRAALAPVNSIGVASRTIPVLNPKLYEEVGTVTDDRSGLVIQFRRGGDWQTDSSVLTAEALFGAKLLQPTKIVRIVSAAEGSTGYPTGGTGPKDYYPPDYSTGVTGE